jgi:hypothetical protein
LREIATRLSYCDRKCYLGRAGIVPALQYHSIAARAPAPAQELIPNFTLDGTR